MKRVALITGASSGIGREVCLKLSEKGYCVYAAARRTDRMKDLEKQGIRVISLDITDEESVYSCVETIRNETGRCDILVNNAGYGSFGTVEDVSIEEARRQIEVNLLGLASVTRRTLPLMRDNHYGRIVNISSTAGKLATPYGAWYHASKFAVEGFSDSLRMEVHRFGIKVIVIEPGFVKTEWGVIAAEHLKHSAENGEYAQSAVKYAMRMNDIYKNGRLTSPEKIAKTIVHSIEADRPRARYVVGFMAKPAIVMKRLLPDKLLDYIMRAFAEMG